MIKQIIPVTDTYSLWKNDDNTFFILTVEFYALEDSGDIKSYSFDTDSFYHEADEDVGNFIKLIKSFNKLPIAIDMTKDELLIHNINPSREEFNEKFTSSTRRA